MLSSAKSSPLLDRKIEETIEGIGRSYGDKIQSTGIDNAMAIVKYISALKTEINLSDSYRGDNIEALTRFSRFFDNKPFMQLGWDDVIEFLGSLRYQNL